MLLISHRGNLAGPEPVFENKPEYVLNALDQKYDAEIDVWFINSQWYLGHDRPQYKINIDYLKNDKLWCHAKNIEAILKMINENIHCFYHQTDDVVLTSRGYLWTYPGKPLTEKSICVLPEQSCQKPHQCFGICSDYIVEYT